MTIFHYDLNKIIEEKHPLKQIAKLINFDSLTYRIKEIAKDSNLGRNGYGLDKALKCIFLQFYYDLSDREMEEELKYNMAMRWFCEFSIDEQTPDHSFFGRARNLIGADKIGKIFKLILKKCEEKKILKNVFTFVDSSAIKAKETTWLERDKALAEGEEKLNNENIENYSSDTDARFGCKGKNKFWFGYKRHASVDMGSGLIKSVAVTPANLSDDKGLKLICPRESIVFGDKGYSVKFAQKIIRQNISQSAVILKNNMINKNKDLDKWRSKLRSPFENIFSKLNKKTRYRGLVKTQFQVCLEAIVFNVKRLITINAPPLFVGA